MSTRRTFKTVVAIAAAAVAALGTNMVAAGPAAASTAQYWYVQSPPCDPVALSPWSLTVDNATGWFKCGSHVMDVMWADGHHELFGIGTDGAVWHIVPGWSQWYTMHGGVINVGGAYYSDQLSYFFDVPTIEVTGTDNLEYCTFYAQGDWDYWKRC